MADETNKNEKLIVNCIPVREKDRQRFIEAAGDVPIEFCGDYKHYGDMKVKAQIPEGLRGKATAVLGNFDPSIAEQFTNLEWLQTWSAGVDAYIKPGVLPESVTITSATGAYGQSVGEHMIAMMWALMKNFTRYVCDQTKHQWKDEGTVLTPNGATALVIGTGDIGSHFARLAKGAGMRTVGVRRSADKPVEGIDEMHGFDELDTLLPQADVVALSLPRAADTHHLLDARRIGLLKKDAIVINGGRGDALDDDALAEALSRGAIRGAGLDVFETEPLPSDHPLWDEPRCLMTPHVAGGSHLASNDARIVDIAVANVRRYVNGEPLQDNAHR
ncbi:MULTISPECIES: D-2-hydroxyacid dehydrogenase [unclassified Bifidobacterium]|uniref:D-2-hydroxyacid dehydrogenase n=1 Tax=unclassified Bifidobacterium TaxID=2608897 RepID=UPI0023FA2480|nr:MULTISPECIES: D-2-hydroxyacid dehydrogenase [unclassified Bifidobacterium]WEV66455.1 D-2-hydroxyacid dehydrogenase [Bifidobacterium sp. ESL0764]WEV76269.1 D-2-hydroxyacid dehydrogenase [Bifidobacterium sp. ESL0800]